MLYFSFNVIKFLCWSLLASFLLSFLLPCICLSSFCVLFKRQLYSISAFLRPIFSEEINWRGAYVENIGAVTVMAGLKNFIRIFYLLWIGKFEVEMLKFFKMPIKSQKVLNMKILVFQMKSRFSSYLKLNIFMAERRSS